MLNPYDVSMKIQSKDRLSSSLRRQLETERARVIALREALDAIAESEWDASAGLLRDIANTALAADAFRLMVDCSLVVDVCDECRDITVRNDHHAVLAEVTYEAHNGDKHAATRRAIVRAAAAIGAQKKTPPSCE